MDMDTNNCVFVSTPLFGSIKLRPNMTVELIWGWMTMFDLEYVDDVRMVHTMYQIYLSGTQWSNVNITQKLAKLDHWGRCETWV